MSDVLTPKQRNRCMSKAKTLTRKSWCGSFCFQKAFAAASQTNAYLANLILYSRNIAPLYLLTAAFGMVTKAASTLNDLQPTLNFGTPKFPETSSAALALATTLKSWGGVSLSFDNANSNPKRLRPHLIFINTLTAENGTTE